ncbi:hypothetical protein [Frigidibacter sp. MR17.24]|uniref:hypothetical protein n=1 Tax=Frigidibacter sp. MR17.24 TaxID=3127345 RepID=UPI003012C763
MKPALALPAPGRPLLRPDRLAALARRIVSPGSATADLYLGFACADAIAAGRIERHAPTVFRAGRTLIVARHDSGLARLPDHDRLVYIIDDDWRAGIADPRLPAWYRLKLAAIEGRAARRLERAAGVILTGSPRLAALYRRRGLGGRVRRIEPAWPAPAAALPPPAGCATRLAYLGAATHQDDARWLAQVLGPLLAGGAALRLLWSGNHPLPRAWEGDARVTRLPAMGWQGYRDWMAGERFDIGLYPLRPGGFNAARSVNKLGEYDQFGAAVLASARWSAARGAAARGACVLAPDDPRRWRYELARMLEEPGRAHATARANRALQAAGGLAAQRRLWSGLLPGVLPGVLPAMPAGEDAR